MMDEDLLTILNGAEIQPARQVGGKVIARCPLCGGEGKLSAKRSPTGKLLAACAKCSGPVFEFIVNNMLKRSKVSDVVSLPVARKDSADQILRGLHRFFAETMTLNGTDPASKYLFVNRGLGILQDDLLGNEQFNSTIRWHPEAFHPQSRKRYPALVAAVQNNLGEVISCRLIYLTADGQKAPVDPVKRLWRSAWDGITNGACHRLFSIENGQLAIAEGIENALAVRAGTGLPVWAAGDAHRLSCVDIPAEVTWLRIYADQGDVGEAAAQKLAHKAVRAKQIESVKIIVPPRSDNQRRDWNDFLVELENNGTKSKEYHSAGIRTG